MWQPTRVRFSQQSTRDVQCIAWGIGCLQASLPTRAVRNSTEQRKPNLSLVHPHCCPQSGVQVSQSREDCADLDPYSEDDEKIRHRPWSEGTWQRWYSHSEQHTRASLVAGGERPAPPNLDHQGPGLPSATASLLHPRCDLGWPRPLFICLQKSWRLHRGEIFWSFPVAMHSLVPGKVQEVRRCIILSSYLERWEGFFFIHQKEGKISSSQERVFKWNDSFRQCSAIYLGRRLGSGSGSWSEAHTPRE